MKLLETTVLIICIMTVAACTNINPGTQPASSDLKTESTASILETQTPDVLVIESKTPDFTPTTVAAPNKPTEISIIIDPDKRPNYVISAVLDYAWRFLTVEQEVTIPNISYDIISELMLIVQPNWRPDVFNLTDITWESGEPIQSYVIDGIQLRILLVDPLKPGESVRLSLAYEIKVPPILTSEDFGPNPFGYTSRQMNFTDWYPFVPPYIEGDGWLVHNPWYYGEHLVYPTADFDVTIQMHNVPANTLIAASALDLDEGDSAKYHIEGARNFVWSVSPEYRVFQENVGDTTVFGYTFPYDVVPGEAAFKATVNAIEVYNEIFGEYPFSVMTQVQADFDHGMEYSGLYFLSKGFYNTYDGTPSTYLVAIAAHETAHQWWYGLIGNDQAMEPWLDEALCTYSEKLFYEKLFPRSINWWEYSRVNYYDPKGWVDSTIYNTTSYRAYRDAVYLQGARFLDELRGRVGDEVFFPFLKDYVHQNAYQLVTADDFFNTLDEHSDEDWEDLLAIYFENP